MVIKYPQLAETKMNCGFNCRITKINELETNHRQDGNLKDLSLVSFAGSCMIIVISVLLGFDFCA